MGDGWDESVWHWHSPVKLTAGQRFDDALQVLVSQGASVLVVTTPGFTRRGVTSRVSQALGSAARMTVWDQVTPNPELDALDQATVDLSEVEPDVIVAIGGGSAMDAAKVLSVTLPLGTPDTLSRVLREGSAQSWEHSIPVLAIPTTAGTGAEATPFATVWDVRTRRKFSVQGPAVLPRHAVLDPHLCVSLSRDQILYSGLDAISHALESLWNRNRTPMSETFARQALELAAGSFPRVLEAPETYSDHSAMLMASFFSGLAISQTRTAIAHSISYPLTLQFGVPHGLACSFTLPAILQSFQKEIVPDLIDVGLFDRILSLLRGLALPVRVADFASEAEINSLLGEMYTPERAENFAFKQDVQAVLAASRE